MSIHQTCPLTGTVPRRKAKAGPTSRHWNIVAGAALEANARTPVSAQDRKTSWPDG
jgi:hypothetical protein